VFPGRLAARQAQKKKRGGPVDLFSDIFLDFAGGGESLIRIALRTLGEKKTTEACDAPKKLKRKRHKESTQKNISRADGVSDYCLIVRGGGEGV